MKKLLKSVFFSVVVLFMGSMLGVMIISLGSRLVLGEKESRVYKVHDVNNLEPVHDVNKVHRFGREEYECFGSCYCEGERRTTAVGTRVGLRYVAAALTSILAIEKARSHFSEKCEQNYEEFCDDRSLVRSEVDDCYSSDGIGDQIMYTDSGSYSCQGHCGEEVSEPFGGDENACWCDSRCSEEGNDDCCGDKDFYCSADGAPPRKTEKEVEDFVKKDMKYVSQACIRIKSRKGQVIYTDPYQTEEVHDADIVLITHQHYDHWSVKDCMNVAKEDTVFLVPKSFADEVGDKLPDHAIMEINPNQYTHISGIRFDTIPAYNTEKEFHKKSENWVGYIIDLEDGLRIYHSGDTNRIPEMKGIDVDVSLLPLGQTYTMDDTEESVLAARDTGCKVAVPMHYGLYEGEDGDAKVFEEGCKKIGIGVINLKDMNEEEED